jgi:hypothetical protein
VYLLYWYKSTNTDTQLRAQGLEYQVNVRSYSRYNYIAGATSTDNTCQNVVMSGAGLRHAGVCKTLRLGVHAQVELLNFVNLESYCTCSC